jgi:N-acetyl-gamma-glutamyl-phosphate reductase
MLMTVSTMYLAQAGLIEKEDIIIDAKSGVSGAGRSAKQNLLYTEIAEGINCYGVGSHRHMPEIEQVSSAAFHTATRSVLAAGPPKG